MTCDDQGAIPRLIVGIVAVVIPMHMYGEHWLALLSKVCNYTVWASSIITRFSNIVDYATLVSVIYIIHKL